VKGETDTPDFQLDTGGRPVPLKARFHAVVDGTNGDTLLEHVQARLAETPIQARGAVVRAKDVKGRHVSLDVSIDEGRIEDVLRLAADTDKPGLTGRVSVQSKLRIPAGDEKVIDRLELDGRFALAQARFTSYNVQKRITELSRRASGQGAGSSGESVVSNMSGRFVLHGGVLRLSSLTFAVPGAVVRLDGTYALRSQQLDFTGDLLLDATLAETTTGVKALVAKIFQPMFRGPKGGTKLPIKVAGTREKPEFGLDVKRALTPGN
jgi:AsmA-like C-terminal region